MVDVVVILLCLFYVIFVIALHLKLTEDADDARRKISAEGTSRTKED